LKSSGKESATETSEKKLFIPASVPAPLLEAARSLRKNMTDAEQLLWFCLRRRQLGGFRFRRQHPFAQFVLDFYCCEAKVAVELDGGQHNNPDVHRHDKERTELLNNHDIQVVRFWNHEVFRDLEEVLQAIFDVLRNRSAQDKKEQLHPPP